MSLVKANTYQDASGGSNAVFSGVANPPNSMGFRNRSMNGDMRIVQRNAGASVSVGTGAPFIVDRWNAYTDLVNMTGQRSTTAPAGFTNSLLLTVGTGASPAAGQISRIEQRVEGFNSSDLGWGSASAQSVALSFWVRSSVTGTHSGALSNSAGNRSYPFTFTVSAANTFEYKTVTVVGDTSGTWLTDNGTGIKVIFNTGTGATYLGAAGAWAGATYFGATGSVQLAATSGATFYITGVQLEAGTNATNFERRDYGRELTMCQRYFIRYSMTTFGINGFNESSAGFMSGFAFPLQMRSAPTLVTTGTASDYSIRSAGLATTCNAVPTLDSAGVSAGRLQATVSGGLTAGGGSILFSSTNQYLGLNAEL